VEVALATALAGAGVRLLSEMTSASSMGGVLGKSNLPGIKCHFHEDRIIGNSNGLHA
jgi:hypothetical protein